MAAALLSLAGSEWGLAVSSEPYVQFGDGSVSGSGGCNRFAGSYTFDGSRIAISQMAVTSMACIDDGVMVREAAFLKALIAARQAEATQLTLVLKDETGAELLALQRRDWD